jgi:DNA-binding transcriptional ArsR family regulator
MLLASESRPVLADREFALRHLQIAIWDRKMIKTTNTQMIERSATLLTAMANPKRLEILSLLVSAELPVGVLAENVGLSQSALSQHLAKLRAEKLVSTRREAQTIYYSSRSPAVLAILAELDNIFGNNGENTAKKTPKTASG